MNRQTNRPSPQERDTEKRSTNAIHIQNKENHMKSFYEMTRMLENDQNAGQNQPSEGDWVTRLLRQTAEDQRKKARDDYYRVEREKAAEQRKKEEAKFRYLRRDVDDKNPLGKQSKGFSPEFMQYAGELKDRDLINSPIDRFRREIDDILAAKYNLKPIHAYGLEFYAAIDQFFPNLGDDEDMQDKFEVVAQLIDDMFDAGYSAEETAAAVERKIKSLGLIRNR